MVQQHDEQVRKLLLSNAHASSGPRSRHRPRLILDVTFKQSVILANTLVKWNQTGYQANVIFGKLENRHL